MGSNQSDRLRSVLVGRRKVGSETLELMVSNEQADDALAEHLPVMIRLENVEPAEGLLNTR